MGNRKVSLLWYCRTPRGWRRFPVLLGKNNRIRHAYVKDGDSEVSYPDGHYEVMYYEGRKPRYKNVGDHPTDAVAARDREAYLLVARESAEVVGAKIVEEEARTYIRRAAGLYIQDAENRKAMEASEQARLVTEEFMEICRKTFVDEIVKDDVYRFHRALRERGCGDRTVSNKHARLKSFLKFAGVDVKEVMPAAPKYENKLPTIYTPAQIKAIRAASDPYMRLMVDMALKLGLREQELEFAQFSDIDWENSVFRVTGKDHLGFTIKDNEQRDIPIPSDLLQSLQEWQEQHKDRRLILATSSGSPNGHLLRNLKQTAKKGGLNCGQCDGCKTVKECQEWTLHSFRRTFLTTLLRSGLDLKTVQAYAGHSDLASTMRYLRPASTEETQKHINSIQWE